MQTLEIKAALVVDDAGTITGTAWPFGSGPDRVGDVIEKGAFRTSAKLPMLFAHDQAQAVGVWDDIQETADGLTVKGRLLIDDVTRAREVRALVREGAVTGLSIGFATKKATSRKGGGRTISALDLHEISIVPVPCHPGATITMAKAASTEGGLMPVENEGAAPDFAAFETKLAEMAGEVKSVSQIIGRMDKLEARLNRPATGDNDNTDAATERKAFHAYLRHGNNTPLDDLKALTVSSDPQGGYLAPAEVSTEFIRDLVEFSPIRALATVRTTSAPSVSYPKRTSGTNAKWKGETETSEESGATFGQLEVAVHEINTFVDISNQLLADSGGVAEAEVRSALAEDFGLKEATAFVKGGGFKSPQGILTSADVAIIKTGNAATLGAAPADMLIDFMYSLMAGYRGRGTWLMNGKTLATVRKLKDGQGNYLWQPSYQAGNPETILGRPVVEAPDMEDIGAGTTPIMFGDIATAYRIIDRLALSLLTNPFTRATEGITRIHATRRTGAGVVQPAAISKIVCAV